MKYKGAAISVKVNGPACIFKSMQMLTLITVRTLFGKLYFRTI